MTEKKAPPREPRPKAETTGPATPAKAAAAKAAPRRRVRSDLELPRVAKPAVIEISEQPTAPEPVAVPSEVGDFVGFDCSHIQRGDVQFEVDPTTGRIVRQLK